MRIAVITKDIPLPVVGTGGNLVIHNLSRGLAEKHELRFFILNRGFYDICVPSAKSDPQAFPYEFEECPRDGGGGPSDRKISRATRYYITGPHQLTWLEKRIAAYGAERIVGFGWDLAPYFGLLRLDVPKILDLIDSEVLYLINQVAAGNLSINVLKRLVAAFLVDREHLWRSDAVVTVSLADTKTVRRTAGIKNVFTVPNGVDHEYYAPGPSAARNPRQVIFCGSLSFEPNVQAITWFVTKCWNHVLARKPDAQLLVIGKAPPPDLKSRLESFPRVQCVGPVEDVRPYICASALSVAPMVSGGGIKNKILEAWAMGTPVVATELAVNGMACRNGEDVLISRSANDFAAHVVSLLNDSARRDAMGAAGRSHVVKNYSWDQSRVEFTEIVETTSLAPSSSQKRPSGTAWSPPLTSKVKPIGESRSAPGVGLGG